MPGIPTQEQLDKYADTMHTLQPCINKTPYQILGVISKYHNIPTFEYAIDNIQDKDNELCMCNYQYSPTFLSNDNIYKYILIAYYLLDSFSWFISTVLLYYEYIRNIPQSWTSLRLFWCVNGLYEIAKTFSLIYSSSINMVSIMVIYIFQSFLSFILLCLSLFFPYDYQTTDESFLSNLLQESNNTEYEAIDGKSNASKSVRYKLR